MGVLICILLFLLYIVMAWTGATLPLPSHYLTALSLTQSRGVQWLDDSEQRTEQEVCAVEPYIDAVTGIQVKTLKSRTPQSG